MRRISIGSFVSLLAAMLLSSATYAATPKIGHTAGGKKAVSLKSAGAPKIISARKKLRANKIVLSKRKLGLHRAAYASALSGVPPMLTAGDLAGLSLTRDPLDLKSNVALVLDQSTNEILFEKNAEVALPIASITKLMTSLVVVEANQNLEELLSVTEEDLDREKFTHSRLRVGSQLTRANMLHIALMSSEIAPRRHWVGTTRVGSPRLCRR